MVKIIFNFSSTIMEFLKKRNNSLTEWLFLALLVVNNFAAFYFLVLPFVAGLSSPYRMYSETEMYIRIFLYDFIVSLFFSLISLAITYFFKKHLLRFLTGRLKFFLTQVGFLFLIFVAVIFFFYRLPDLRF